VYDKISCDVAAYMCIGSVLVDACTSPHVNS